MKNRLWWIVSALVLSLTMGSGCFEIKVDDKNKDDDDNSDDGDDDADDDDDDDDNNEEEIPVEVDDFLSDADMEALEDVGMTIYKGNNPPNIEDTFFLDTLEIKYDDLDIWLNIVSYTYEFYNQTDDGEVSMSYSAPDAYDEATGLGAFISGDGDCFSVFLNIEGTANGCDYKQPGIISGCLNSSGITGWENGFIMAEKSGENCDMLIEAGHRRIIIEADDLAAFVD